MTAENADYDEIIEMLCEKFKCTKEEAEHVIQVKLNAFGVFMTPREHFEYLLKKKDLH